MACVPLPPGHDAAAAPRGTVPGRPGQPPQARSPAACTVPLLKPAGGG